MKNTIIKRALLNVSFGIFGVLSFVILIKVRTLSMIQIKSDITRNEVGNVQDYTVQISLSVTQQTKFMEEFLSNQVKYQSFGECF